MKSKFLAIKDFFLDILFPPICVSCRTHLAKPEKEKLICGACLQESITNTTLFCSTCHARLPENKKICHRDSKYLLGAATHYTNDQARNIIWELKYKRVEATARAAAEILRKYIELLDFDFSSFVIVPIPLHRSRLRKRGFNQVELIADVLTTKTSLTILKNSLIKKHHTPPQVEITDWDKRKENVQDCFKIKKPERIEKRNIILLDDISTSGATLSEATRVLKEAGAKKVIGLVVAKAR